MSDPKKEKKEKKKRKKEKKEEKKEKKNKRRNSETDEIVSDVATKKSKPSVDEDAGAKIEEGTISIVLFYQYIEPQWTALELQKALQFFETNGKIYNVTGRARIAREGANCTLTGSYSDLRRFIDQLKAFSPFFEKTEFKFTDGLPEGQRFKSLHAFEVVELVHYGLDGKKAPNIQNFGGTHLEPEEYHEKMAKGETVVIDVRNHYEASIGRFVPPTGGAEYIDPMMRKSTEFPVWLDKPETQEKLKNKTVLMYCTGGIRCERASALLKQKIETEEDTKKLGIKGVYQLQGGIDKYFKVYDQGGYWQGKNYVFDKRFAHAADKVPTNREEPMGKCEACHKPYDKFRGKRRCPTCGVPSLICKECMESNPNISKDRQIKCDLCVKENVKNKHQLKERINNELQEYEEKLKKISKAFVENPHKVTRLFVGNLHIQNIDEETLCQAFPGITHIQWLTDRKTGNFYGSAFVEMASADDAAKAVGKNGMKVLGRPVKVKFQPADSKDVWPLPNTAVGVSSSNNY